MKVDAMATNTIMRSPSSSGTAILAAAMLIAADRFCFSPRWPNSKSPPIWDIGRIRSIWLIIPTGIFANRRAQGLALN